MINAQRGNWKPLTITVLFSMYRSITCCWVLPWISRVGTPQYSLPDMNHDIYCHRRLSLESNSSTFIYFCLWLKWKNLTNLDCSISISILPTFSLSIFSLLDAIVQFIAIQYEIICNENSVELKMFYIAMSKF